MRTPLISSQIPILIRNTTENRFYAPMNRDAIRSTLASEVPDVATLASSAYGQVRGELLAGTLAPGKKILIKPLADRLGMGLSPVREALNRLSAEGLVVQSDQRGFTALPLALDDLADLTHARRLLNATVLRDSIARGGRDWEEGVVLAQYHLGRMRRHLPEEPLRRDPAWELTHRAYHASLMAACASARLRASVEHLFDAADRYRILSRARPTSRDDEAEHRAITEAVLARDADKAVALLDAHVALTADLVRQTMRTQT
jgi:DNA-binding GntR family transcriptional regulator